MKQTLAPANSRQPLIALALLAQILFAAACVTLPRPAQSAVKTNRDISRIDSGPKININTAAPEMLTTLPGVGRGIAERIVAHRQQYGPFRRAEHLMMVRGISDRKFRELRAMIVVE